ADPWTPANGPHTLRSKHHRLSASPRPPPCPAAEFPPDHETPDEVHAPSGQDLASRMNSIPIPNSRVSWPSPNSAGDFGSDISNSRLTIPSAFTASGGIWIGRVPRHSAGVHVQDDITWPAARQVTFRARPPSMNDR